MYCHSVFSQSFQQIRIVPSFRPLQLTYDLFQFSQHNNQPLVAKVTRRNIVMKIPMSYMHIYKIYVCIHENKSKYRPEKFTVFVEDVF
jgi:hypothetical protein